MTRGKGWRGKRGAQNRESHGGPKQSAFELDTDMVDGPGPRREWRYHNRDSTQQGRNSRAGVGKASRASSQVLQSIFSSLPAQSSFARDNPFHATAPAPSVFAEHPRRHVRRAVSIVTCESALSTQAGAYCYKCSGINRKLRQAMYDLLETTFKSGKQLIDEWAWEAGVSPDHMDCERTKMLRFIPEGLRGEGEPCCRCKVDMLGPQRGSASLAQQSFAPATAHHQQQQQQQQQRMNPFVQVGASNPFTRQQPPMAAPQFPRLMSLTAPSNLPTIMEQEPAYDASTVGFDQATQPQVRPSPYQQQQQDHNGAHAWDLLGAQSHQSSMRQQPLINPLLEQTTYNADSVYQAVQKPGEHLEHFQAAQMPPAQPHPFDHQQPNHEQEQEQEQEQPRSNNPLTRTTGLSLGQVPAVASFGQMTVQRQQNPFYQHPQPQQEQPLNSHRRNNPFVDANDPALGHTSVESPAPHDSPPTGLISPPLSHEMTVTGMLNHTVEEPHPLDHTEGVRATRAPSPLTVEQEVVEDLGLDCRAQRSVAFDLESDQEPQEVEVEKYVSPGLCQKRYRLALTVGKVL
ncbi:unnamed protein product [Discula destructiva]